MRPCAAREDLRERLADDLLGLRDARALGVRRVAEQEVDAAVADLRELPDVGALSVDRRVVDLVVAGVHDPPAGRLEDDGGRVGDRVRHAHELDPERAEVEGLVAGSCLAQIGFAQQAVLVELRLDEPHGQARRDDDGDLHLAHQVRQRADVVLVPVREHDAADHRLALAEVREVRQDEVDAEVLVARERKTCVDDHDRSLRLVGGHVLPDFAEPAERDDVADAHIRSASVVATYAGAVCRTPARSRHERICVELGRRRIDHREPVAAELVAEQVHRGLDRNRVRRDLQEVESRRHLLVDAPCAVDVAALPQPDHLLRLRPPDVGVDADSADAAEREEREDQVVVAGVQVEASLGNAARLVEIVVRLLDGPHVRDLRELRDRVRLDVDDDAARDVVDDDGLVGGRSDLLEVAHDRALRRLVVVRRHDEHRVDPGLVRQLRQMDGMAGVVRAGAGDDGRAVSDRLDGRREQLELLLVGERRALARRPCHDDPVGAVVDEMHRELAELRHVDRAVRVERRQDRGQNLTQHAKSVRE